MTDVTIASFEEMEPIVESGLARRARATLGPSAWGMQVFTLPPDWNGHPEHNHDEARPVFASWSVVSVARSLARSPAAASPLCGLTEVPAL